MPVKTIESKRVDSTKRMISEKNERVGGSKRASALDGNNVQSVMDSLNDRGDSSEQALTPLELAKL